MRIVIIGGGFAGLSALQEFYGKSSAELLLIDRKDTFDFLPAVPDLVGRGIHPSSVTLPLETACARSGARFLKAQVTAIDTERFRVLAASVAIPYDRLLLASGAETNFFGNTAVAEHGFALYTVADALRLLCALKEREFDVCVVCGGGYTGVEAVTCLRRYFVSRGVRKKIILVELSSTILSSLPGWMRDYAERNLRRMGIEVVTGISVKDYRDNGVTLSDGTRLEKALLVWSAGVKTPEFTRSLPGEKDRQGRVAVDPFLSFAPGAFAAGDAALFRHNGMPLRMAVQFSIMQGRVAAANILRSFSGKPLTAYKPVDLGYVIPMANNRSCGLLFSSLRVRGLLPTLMHYLMCLYRTPGWRRRMRLAADLIR